MEGPQGSGVPGTGARGRGNWTGAGGGGSWQTGLWDGDCRKEMLNPCVCSSQHRFTVNVCLVKPKTHKTARFFLPKENGVTKMRQGENRGRKSERTRSHVVYNSQDTSGRHRQVRATWLPVGKRKYFTYMFHSIREMKIKAPAQEMPSYY